jgi:hypothetical protein
MKLLLQKARIISVCLYTKGRKNAARDSMRSAKELIFGILQKGFLALLNTLLLKITIKRPSHLHYFSVIRHVVCGALLDEDMFILS